jgi:hypothetical protein
VIRAVVIEEIKTMKCQCPSSAHGHRPGHCVSAATTETYCPRCHTEKAKEDVAKPQGGRAADTRPRAERRNAAISTSSVGLGEGE